MKTETKTKSKEGEKRPLVKSNSLHLSYFPSLHAKNSLSFLLGFQKKRKQTKIRDQKSKTTTNRKSKTKIGIESETMERKGPSYGPLSAASSSRQRHRRPSHRQHRRQRHRQTRRKRIRKKERVRRRGKRGKEREQRERIPALKVVITALRARP